MNPHDTITDPIGITERAPSSTTSVSDKAGITQPDDKNAQNANAKPKIDQLFIYDQSLNIDGVMAIHDVYYPNAKMVAISDWSDIKAALSKYAEVSTLIFDTHSKPGDLLIGENSHTPSAVQQSNLTSTGVKVTQSIIFEGCEIMGDPVATARLVSGITQKNTRVSGYNIFSVVAPITLVLTGEETAEEILTALAPHQPFLLPSAKTPEKLAGTKGEVRFIKRWFRRDLDDSLPPDIPPGGFPPRDFKTRNDMIAVKVSTKDKAAEVKADSSSPVPLGYFVTVDNIQAVIAP